MALPGTTESESSHTFSPLGYTMGRRVESAALAREALELLGEVGRALHDRGHDGGSARRAALGNGNTGGSCQPASRWRESQV